MTTANKYTHFTKEIDGMESFRFYKKMKRAELSYVLQMTVLGLLVFFLSALLVLTYYS